LRQSWAKKGAHAVPAALSLASISQTIHLNSSSNINLILQGAIRQMILTKIKTTATFIGAAAAMGATGYTAFHAQAQLRIKLSTSKQPRSIDESALRKIA
jgi:uncharacterized membrane protein YebE (DUF533 family)